MFGCSDTAGTRGLGDLQGAATRTSVRIRRANRPAMSRRRPDDLVPQSPTRSPASFEGPLSEALLNDVRGRAAQGRLVALLPDWRRIGLQPMAASQKTLPNG